MSETPIETPAEPTDSVPVAPEEPKADAAPPWGDDFDPERAWKTITNLRAREKELSQSQVTAEQREALTEYERLAEANKTELQRAQETAKAATDRATGMLRDVATAKLELALTNVPEDVKKALLEDINVDKFITDDGVNAEAINAFGTKYAAFAPPEKPGMKPNPSQGRSASPSPTINEQIAQAQGAGDIKTAIRLKSQMALDASEG
jgi:hypothetical protein